MIKRLVAFGDSWTYGQGIEKDIHYKEYRYPNDFINNLRRSNSWVRWLADKYQIPFVNLSSPGICNPQIKNILKENIPFLNKEEDLILIMLSFPYRHHLWEETVPPFDMPVGNIVFTINELLEGYNYYILNSFYPTFNDEPELKNELDLSRFLEVDKTAADVLITYENLYNISVWEYGIRNVKNKENFDTGSYHPNLLGYQVIADWIFNILNSEKN